MNSDIPWSEPESATPPPELDAGPETATAESKELSFSARLLSGFQGNIEPPGIAPLYQFSLLLVCGFMVLLPVLYLLLIGVVGWGVVWYAQHFSWLVTGTGGGGRVYLLRVVLYVGPQLAGGVAVVFMFKPLFAGRSARVQPLAINPGAEPVLYAFICKVCHLVRAPLPAEIALSSDVNASASFRHGLFSRELRLTIGMPLVAGLTVNQFAGVLAHEFGHFTQGFGMRLTYVIRQINGWFARVVYERDAWDDWLDELGEGSESAAWSLVVLLAHAAVGVSRLILRVLMFTGHFVSCYALRQMEYGADEFEAKVAGTPAFEATMLRVQLLGLAEGVGREHIGRLWETKQRVPDDLANFIGNVDASLGDEKRNEIENSLGLQPTRWHDTHPSTADRIRAVRRLAAPGVFHLDWPSTLLFHDFAVLSRQVTLTHYLDEVGLPVTESNLIAVGSAGEKSSSATEDAGPPPERPRIRLKVGNPPPAEPESPA